MIPTKKYFNLLLLLSILLPFGGESQNSNHYAFELLTENNRTNFGDVHNLYQDSAGVIWLGVYGIGLANYYGDEIKRFYLPNEGKFSQQNNVFIADDNILALNYTDKVCLFDAIKERITDTISIGSSMRVTGSIKSTAFYKHNNQNIYLWGSHSSGVKDSLGIISYRIISSSNKKPFTTLSRQALFTYGAPLLLNIETEVIYKTLDGLEVMNLDGEILRKFQINENILTNMNSLNIAIDEKNNLWYSSKFEYKSNDGKGRYSGYLYKLSYDFKEIDSIKTEVPTESYMVNDFLNEANFLKAIEVADSKVFITQNTYFDIQEGRVESINTQGIFNIDLKSINGFYTSLVDRHGVIWMGGGNNFGKLVPLGNSAYLLPSISTRNFIEDSKGIIYGTDNRYNPATQKIIDSTEWINNWYHAILKKDIIHFGRAKIDLRSQKSSKIRYNPELNAGELILEDDKGQIWQIGWDKDKIFITQNGRDSLVNTILISEFQEKPVELNDWYLRPSDKSIWLGTYGQGIFIFDSNNHTYTRFDNSATSKIPLKNNIVTCFYEDVQQNIWFGHGMGLSCISSDLDKITHYQIHPDIPDSHLIYGILPDDDGDHLWLSSDHGIYKFDMRNGTFFDFPLHEYMMDLEYNRSSYFKGSNGQLYFGSANSKLPTVSFFPDSLDYYYNNVDFSAKIIISDLKKHFHVTDSVITTSMHLQDLIEIKMLPGDQYFELLYFTSDFRNPDEVYYSHFLEGYDNSWSSPAKSKNHVRYENLPSGDYTLYLSGSLSKNQTQSNLRKIKIYVLPYWYETWWAKAFFLLIMILTLYAIYKINMNRQLERLESKRIKELDKFKSQVYTNITHEFRTPLTVILGMNDNITGHDSEKSLIKRNANQLLKLINQLLDLAKLDDAKLKMEMTSGDILAFIKIQTESFYPLANKKGIHLKYNSNNHVANVMFDELKMQQIIYNLISNAIKFTPEGGAISVSTSAIKNKNTIDLSINIKDNGIGINKSDLPYIFDRFYQSTQNKSNGKISTEGTGIGLALTKELVATMGGNIKVTSQINQGAEFQIYFPLQIADSGLLKNTINNQSNNQSNNPKKEKERSRKTDFTDLPSLLIIEDNDDVVTYLTSILEGDYVISIATDGQKGINKAMETIPDLIISDVMMPEKDGYQVCKTLKNDERTSHIPIVMLTAKIDFESKIDGFESGADAYLSKPFNKTELLIRLNKLHELRANMKKFYIGINDRPKTSNAKSKEEEFLLKLRNIVTNNLDNTGFTIPEFSKAAFFSHTQLYRKIKALTDQTPSQFISDIRLTEASKMIKSSNLSISEIAFAVGYSDPGYFTKMFKNKYGQSPSEYRLSDI